MEFNKRWQLTKEEQKELGRQFIITGDLNIKSRLIRANIKWTNKLARSWVKIPIEDSISVANVALCECVDTWNPDKGSLTNYVTTAVRFAMLSYLRDYKDSYDYLDDKCDQATYNNNDDTEIWSLIKNKLTPDEFYILKSMFLFGFKEVEIAKMMSVSPQYINKLKKKSFAKLKCDYDTLKMRNP